MSYDIEQLKADVRASLDWVALQYPEKMFKEPKSGRHGTVDGCSARGVRHAVKLAQLQIERTFAMRQAPPSACKDCLELAPNLVMMEIYKHSWQKTEGPLVSTGKYHWAKITGEEAKGPSLTRRCTTLRAICGVDFGYEVDSGD